MKPMNPFSWKPLFAVCSAAALLAPLAASAAEGAPAPAPAPSAPAEADAAPTDSAAAQQVTVRGRRPPAQGSLRSLSGAEAALVPGAGNDSIRALQSLPGVVSPSDASGEPAVRGSRPGDNSYLMDFVPVGYVFHAGGLVSVVPGELVQRFDLHSAAFGPQFDDVTGAVVDVALREPRIDRLGLKLDLSFLSGGFVAEGPVAEGHSFIVAARRSYLDFLNAEIKDDTSGVITRLPRYSDYQFKYLWQINERQRLSLHLNGASDHIDYQIPAGSTLSQQEPVLTGDGRDDTRYDTRALQWEADAGPGLDNRLALGQIQTRIGAHTGSAVDLGAQVRTDFLREQLHWKPAPQHELWLGAELNRSRVGLDLDLRNAHCTEFSADCDLSGADELKVHQRLNMDQRDWHVRERWQLQPSWALSLGLRHSDDQYLKQQLTEPRLGLEWAWSPSTWFSAAWGQHHQQPSAAQILPTIGNPGLRELRARHSMLGMDQQLAGGWNWRAEIYDKSLSGLVIGDALRNYVNGGSGHAWGAELLLRKDGGGPLSGWASVSWARADRHNDQTGQRFNFEYDQPLVFNLVGRWKQSEVLSYGARLSLHSGSLYTPITGTVSLPDGRIRPVYGELNSQRLPSYARLDLRADWRLSQRLTAYGELINATNHRNISGWAYNADYTQRTAETQLPLLISLGAQWAF